MTKLLLRISPDDQVKIDCSPIYIPTGRRWYPTWFRVGSIDLPNFNMDAVEVSTPYGIDFKIIPDDVCYAHGIYIKGKINCMVDSILGEDVGIPIGSIIINVIFIKTIPILVDGNTFVIPRIPLDIQLDKHYISTWSHWKPKNKISVPIYPYSNEGQVTINRDGEIEIDVHNVQPYNIPGAYSHMIELLPDYSISFTIIVLEEEYGFITISPGTFKVLNTGPFDIDGSEPKCIIAGMWSSYKGKRHGNISSPIILANGYELPDYFNVKISRH